MVSEIAPTLTNVTAPSSLNPYCSGIWSRRIHYLYCHCNFAVLILIVVEYGLGVYNERNQGVLATVLILIVVEYGLGALFTFYLFYLTQKSLNPYCSGIWSRRLQTKAMWSAGGEVLILIVVEYGLGAELYFFSGTEEELS